jgi:hypothetical protein
MIAGLVILDADPLADINNARSIRAVALIGRLITHTAPDSMLSEAKTLANQLPPWKLHSERGLPNPSGC